LENSGGRWKEVVIQFLCLTSEKRSIFNEPLYRIMKLDKKEYPLVVLRQLTELANVLEQLESDNKAIIQRQQFDGLIQFSDRDKPQFHFLVENVIQINDGAVKFKVKYVPSDPNNKSSSAALLSTDKVAGAFRNWIKFLTEYNNTRTDYWQFIKSNLLTIESIDFTENLPFSEPEKDRVSIELSEIKDQLAQHFDLTEQQIEIANQKIDYLIEATNRLKKTDWKGLAIGLIFTVGYDLALDNQKWSKLLGLFSKLWSAIKLLPPMGM
jgi:hypothetical protein